MEQFGNFSSHTIIKLVSKYNKSTISMNNPANPDKIADILVSELNSRIKDENRELPSILHEEIERFEAKAGFLNIFLANS